MTEITKKYWESVYSNKNYLYSKYDGWLDKYLPALHSAERVIDLGCGDGVNSLFLLENRINTIACDFSMHSLSRLSNKIPHIQKLCFDMSTEFPFESSFADIIVADLSLHYFTWEITQEIVDNIFRVLSNKGLLLCRVNSEQEKEHFKNGTRIENGYYFNGENYKRFFNQECIEQLFINHRIILLTQSVTEKYRNKQYMWEIAVEK